jgi:hypothetical protein
VQRDTALLEPPQHVERIGRCRDLGMQLFSDQLIQIKDDEHLKGY